MGDLLVGSFVRSLILLLLLKPAYSVHLYSLSLYTIKCINKQLDSCCNRKLVYKLFFLVLVWRPPCKGSIGTSEMRCITARHTLWATFCGTIRYRTRS